MFNTIGMIKTSRPAMACGRSPPRSVTSARGSAATVAECCTAGAWTTKMTAAKVVNPRLMVTQ